MFGRRQHRNKQDGLPALRFRGCGLPEMLQAGCMLGSRQLRGAGSALLTCQTPPVRCGEVSAHLWINRSSKSSGKTTSEHLEGSAWHTKEHSLLTDRKRLLAASRASCSSLHHSARNVGMHLSSPIAPPAVSIQHSKVTSSKADFQCHFFHGEEIFDVSKGEMFVF